MNCEMMYTKRFDRNAVVVGSVYSKSTVDFAGRSN